MRVNPVGVANSPKISSADTNAIKPPPKNHVSKFNMFLSELPDFLDNGQDHTVDTEHGKECHTNGIGPKLGVHRETREFVRAQSQRQHFKVYASGSYVEEDESDKGFEESCVGDFYPANVVCLGILLLDEILSCVN